MTCKKLHALHGTTSIYQYTVSVETKGSLTVLEELIICWNLISGCSQLQIHPTSDHYQVGQVTWRMCSLCKIFIGKVVHRGHYNCLCEDKVIQFS